MTSRRQLNGTLSYRKLREFTTGKTVFLMTESNTRFYAVQITQAAALRLYSAAKAEKEGLDIEVYDDAVLIDSPISTKYSDGRWSRLNGKACIRGGPLIYNNRIDPCWSPTD